MQRRINRKTHRLITSRYPPIDLFEHAASPEDAKAALLLETLTNSRINPVLERFHMLPPSEHIAGAGSGYIMAAFLYGEPGRFNDHSLGAWYGSFDLPTAMRETIYHHTRRLKQEEDGLSGTVIRMRQISAHVNHDFYDITDKDKATDPLYNASDYQYAQRFAQELRNAHEGGVCYHSIRHEGGINVAVFRPSLLKRVTQLDHFEYEWHGQEEPHVVKLSNVDL